MDINNSWYSINILCKREFSNFLLEFLVLIKSQKMIEDDNNNDTFFYYYVCSYQALDIDEAFYCQRFSVM